MKTFRFAAFLLSAFSLLPVTGWAEEKKKDNPNPKVACVDCFISGCITFPGATEQKGDTATVPRNDKNGTSKVDIAITGKTSDAGTGKNCDTLQVPIKVTGKSKKSYTVNPSNASGSAVTTATATITDLNDGPYVVALIDAAGNECQSAKFDFGCDGCSKGGCSVGDCNTTQGSSVRHTIMMGASFQGDVTLPLVFYSNQVQNPGVGALRMQSGAGVAINPDGNGSLGSVITDTTEALVSAVSRPDDPKAFQVQLKHRVGGVTGNLIQTTVFENIGAGSNMVMRFSTTRDGKTEVADYKHTVDQTGEYYYWSTLTKHNGLWRETIKKKHTADSSQRIERTTVQHLKADATTYEVVSDIEETYTSLANGERMTKQVVAPNAAALTTTWVYWSAGEDTSISGNGSTEGLGKVKRETSPDGRVEEHYYEAGREITSVSYADDSQGVTTDEIANLLTQTTTITRKVGSLVISKTAEENGTDTQTQGKFTISKTYADGSSLLETRSNYYPVGQDFGGKLKKTTNPDGTVTIHELSRSGGAKITVSYQGVAGGDNITEGTKTVRTENAHGQMESEITTAVGTGNGVVLSHMVALTSDDFGRPLTVGHFPNGSGSYAYTTARTYNCCGLATETDQYGVTTTYAHDGLKREVKSNRLGVTTATVYDGLTVSTHRYTESAAQAAIPDLSGATAENLIFKKVTNLAGTVTETWSRSAADGSLVRSTLKTTTYLNPESATPATTLPAGIGMRQVVQTADEFTQTTDYYKDGKIYETFGDLSPAMRYAYSVNAIGEVSSQSYVDGANLRETTTSQSDWAKRNVTTTKGTITQTNTYNSHGQLEKSTDADGVSTLYAYNAKGERTTTAIDINGNSQIDYSGTDRITVSTTAIGTCNSISVLTTSTAVYATNGSNTLTTVSTSHRTPDGLQSWSISAGVLNPTQSITVIGTGGAWTETTTNPDSTKTISTYTDGRLISTEYHSSLASSSLLSSVSYSYDSLGRPVTSNDSSTGTTTTTYISDTCDAVLSTTDPGNRVTSYWYDSQGLRLTTTLPDNTVTHTSYYSSGQVKATWGSQTYPTFTNYDYAGRQKTLRTQPTLATGIPTDAGGSVTTWNYSATTGQLLSKLDYAGKGVIYSYYPAGRIKTCTWARTVDGSPLTTTYGYTAGLLTTTGYSDTTPGVTVSYNRLGQPSIITQFKQSRIEYAYDSNLAVDTETISYDLDHDGTYDFSRVLDRSQDALGRSTGFQLKDNNTIENRADYAYFATDGRLQSISGGGSQASSPANTFTYNYLPNSNLIGKISGPVHDVNNAWEANRNVIASKQNKVGSTVVSQYEYTVNAIGQRTNLATSGSAFANAPSWLWGYDSLGQVISADSNVNTSDRAYQYDTIGNRLKSAESLMLPTSNNYTPNALNQYTATPYGSAGIPPEYDFDGNMTSGPLPAAPSSNSTLAWDGENRLISTTVNGTTTTYLYDAKARRIAVTTGGNTTLYVYDGFNCIAEYYGTTLSKTRLWGIDLSNSLQGAGGVGGLLAEKQGSNIYYPLFEGNGNVSEYIDSAGAVVAHFEYDPFGNTVVNTDSGNLFNYRFSTKPLDFATGLYYYQYRYYDPQTGRWPSRDPIEERGGLNLYGFVRNDGASKIDSLGLAADLFEEDPKNLKLEPDDLSLSYYGTHEAWWFVGMECKDIFWSWFWPDEKKLVVSGYLKIELKINKWKVEHQGLTEDYVPKEYDIAISVGAHEREHARISKEVYNLTAIEANGYEGSYTCSCCDKVKNYVRALFIYGEASAKLQNATFDFNSYRGQISNSVITNMAEAERALNLARTNLGSCKKK